MIELRDVSFEYPEPDSKIMALQHINLAISEGESIGIIGSSGSGKSTLLLHLNGLLQPVGGEVRFRGRNIWEKGHNLRNLRQEIGFLFQFAEANLFGQTVYEDIAYGLVNHNWPEKDRDAQVGRALELVGLDPSIKTRSPFTLSGGEKRRVALAGILAVNPKILILDEPTVGLDPVTRNNFLELVTSFAAAGITVIVVSHDLDEVVRIAKRVIVVANGQLACDGPVREVLSNRNLSSWGLEPSEIIELGSKLGLVCAGQPILNVTEAVAAILARRWRDV